MRTFVLLLAACAAACSSYTTYAPGSAGHAYIVEGSGTVWSCDATTGTPQCWRVVEDRGDEK